MTLLYLILIVFLISCVPLAWIAGRAYFRHRGTRVVTCPETHAPAAVRADGRRVSVSTAFGEPELRIGSCSQWPEHGVCRW
jgi:hypothetical protein